MKIEDKVNHPSHYTWLKDLCGIEVIDITRHMNFNLGNCIKYVLRAGHKSEEGYTEKDKTIEDLFGYKILYAHDGKLPEYLIFVGGLLYDKK